MKVKLLTVARFYSKSMDNFVLHLAGSIVTIVDHWEDNYVLVDENNYNCTLRIERIKFL